MISDLKICLNPPLDYTLEDEQRFIYTYGSVNCRILKFKDANTVIKIMDEFDKDALQKEQKEFILKNSNKEVLVYMNKTYDENIDCFVYGDDNIAFRISCFV